MLKFSEIVEFSKEKFRKIPILKEFEWFEWFEWFGPSPIEPFNSAVDGARPPVEVGQRVAERDLGCVRFFKEDIPKRKKY